MVRKKMLFLPLLFSAVALVADPLVEGFRNPPPEARVQTWWHWTSSYVTRAGITADLEAMKEIGFGGAHLFATGLSKMPEGPKVLSEQWRELFRFASQEAKRLGLELGAHNCPGWTSSGGPWISPENSMQTVVWSAVDVDGGRELELKLEQPLTRCDYYRDIRLVAFPAAPAIPAPTVSADFKLEDPAALTDGNFKTRVTLPVKSRGMKCSVTLAWAEPVTARLIALTFDEPHLFVKGELEVSLDGVGFRPVRRLDIRQTHYQRAAKLLSLGSRPVTAKIWRLNFEYPEMPGWWFDHDLAFCDVKLVSAPMIEAVETRNSASDLFGYQPPAPAEAADPGIDPAELLDLSDKLSADGTLRWNAPAGRWTLLRLGHTATGKVNSPATLTGLECDKLSKRGLDAHFPEMMGKLIADAGPEGTFDYGIIDSYEVGGQNWTDGFAAEFEKRRGYRLDEWYPAIAGYVVVNRAETAKFLFDYQQTVADLFAENYYDYFAELCRRNNLHIILETYGGPFENLRCSREADIPAGEFWIGGTPNKHAGSASHIYGRRFAGAEAFTSDDNKGHGRQDPAMLKRYGDNAFLQGINKLMLHSFVHQPWLNVKPGLTLGRYGSQLNRNATWWKQGAPMVAYLNRAQFLLQQGVPAADLLILAGESAPNTLPVASDVRKAGYDFDAVNVDVLKNRISVDADGSLVLPEGTRYRLLSLGSDRYLTLPTLRRIKELLEAGASVAGVRPSGSPSRSGGAAAAGEWEELVSLLWGDAPAGAIRRIGRGRLIVTNSPLEALKRSGVEPDVILPADFGVIHRRAGEYEIYFIRNNSPRVFDGEVGFRVPGERTPQFWCAADGDRVPAGSYRRDGRYTRVGLRLSPFESAFVVFVPGTEMDHPVRFTPEGGRTLEVSRAVYRARGEEDGRDVTDLVRRQLNRTGLDFTVTNAVLGGDSAPGCVKELLVEYVNGGRPGRIVVQEYQRVAVAAEPEEIDSPLEILEAIYRATDSSTGREVTEAVRRHLAVNGLFLTVTNAALGGDPVPGRPKVLSLRYRIGDGPEQRLEAGEYRRVEIPVDAPSGPEPPQLIADAAGNRLVRFELPGAAELEYASGRKIRFAVSEFPAALKLSDGWQVTFPLPGGGTKTVDFPEAVSWTVHADPEIRYFSGTATYQRSFELPAGTLKSDRRWILDLGNVKNLATVTINGRRAGILWHAPFRLDVTEFLREGTNSVELDVTNLWPNRRIGDLQIREADRMEGVLPAWVLADRPFSENGRSTWCSWGGWQAEDSLLDSGLLGPLRLRPVELVRVGEP